MAAVAGIRLVPVRKSQTVASLRFTPSRVVADEPVATSALRLLQNRVVRNTAMCVGHGGSLQVSGKAGIFDPTTGRNDTTGIFCGERKVNGHLTTPLADRLCRLITGGAAMSLTFASPLCVGSFAVCRDMAVSVMNWRHEP
ncbi:MAG: hypothetical protein ACK5II_00455 [Paracoccus sp. (in: a-proteobacteria)]